ncbi:MAG: hypothetical protein ABF276_03770 [Sulfurovum sp.]
MKKFLFLLLFFSLSFLYSNDVLDDFISEQVNVESQLLDQNISLKEKIKIKEEQTIRYQDFLLEYAAIKE